jgi:DNA repair photolyase
MGLNRSKGNMYEFITHTWNTVKGECYHDCSYCYMKRWGKQKPVHFDEKELKTDLGIGNFIFVGSSCDMWSSNIPDEWINKTLDICDRHYENKYLFQSKNPEAFSKQQLPFNSVVCTTIETNRHYQEIMNYSPKPIERAIGMQTIRLPKYLTIEPIMDFDLKEFIEIIINCEPIQVNIGSDSGNNHLPEPSKEKVLALIKELQKFTTIHNKSNLKRILNSNHESKNNKPDCIYRHFTK